MKKVFQLTATTVATGCLLVSSMCLSQPILAETAAPSQASSSISSTKSKIKAFFEKNLSFTLQHRFNRGKPLAKETITISLKKIRDKPRIVLEEFKKNWAKHLEKLSKPAQIDTAVDFYLPKMVAERVGKLPTVFIRTTVKQDGSGVSVLIMPDEQREVTHDYRDDSKKAIVNWKGLNGEMTFTPKFKSLNLQLKFLGVTIQTEKGSSSTWGESTFSGIFTANLTPSQLEWNLPILQTNYLGQELNLKGFTGNAQLVTNDKNLKLGNLDLKIEHLSLTEEASKISLDDFGVKIKSQEQGEVVNISLLTKIGNLLLPGKESNINYTSDIKISNLDAEAILALQETFRELRALKDDQMKLSLMLGKFMEVTPKFLAKSPEITLTRLSVKTPKGLVQGNATFNLDGKKVTLLIPSLLISALNAEINLPVISKYLLSSALRDKALADLVKAKAFEGKELSDAKLAQLEKQANATSEEKIKTYLAQKILIDADANNCKLVAKFKDNKLTVNGQEMPLSLF